MITDEMIKRINELAKKKKEVGLTEAEAAEQKDLYKDYLDAFRENFKAQLENIEIIDDKKEAVKEGEETLADIEKIKESKEQ